MQIQFHSLLYFTYQKQAAGNARIALFQLHFRLRLPLADKLVKSVKKQVGVREATAAEKVSPLFSQT